MVESKNILIENVKAIESWGDGLSQANISMYVSDGSVTEGSPVITFANTGQNATRIPYINVGDYLYPNSYFADGTTVLEITETTITVSNNAISTAIVGWLPIYKSESQNVRFNKCVCDNNRRNGMTIESGRGIFVTNSSFINTNGVSPEAGIDIEPYYGNQFLRDVFIDNCYFNKNVMGDLFGQNMENLNITNCNFNGVVMFRGSQDVKVSGGCTFNGGLTLKYSALKAHGNTFNNCGIAVYNEDTYTYTKPIDVNVSGNDFIMDYNWDSENIPFVIFNTGNEN